MRTHDGGGGVAQHGGQTPNNRLTERHAALVYCVLLWYWTSMLWSTDTCQNKVSTDQYHVTISRAQVNSSSRSSDFWSWPLTRCCFFIGSRAHVWLTCWKQGRIVWEADKCSPRILRMQMFCCFFCVYGDYWNSKQNEGQTIYRKPRLLHSNCLNWKIYCDDHSSLWSTTAVQIYELFHVYFTSQRLLWDTNAAQIPHIKLLTPCWLCNSRWSGLICV